MVMGLWSETRGNETRYRWVSCDESGETPTRLRVDSFRFRESDQLSRFKFKSRQVGICMCGEIFECFGDIDSILRWVGVLKVQHVP